MDTQCDKHLVWHALGELPTWQKVAIPIVSLMIAPFMLLVATLTFLSLVPLLLLGRWEGNLGKRPLVREVKRALEHERVRTHEYYATT
jgi:hypothetical protein